MSLLRLLTTGKSLVGLTDTDSRYRLTHQRLLPQFGPTRNPFSSSGKSEPVQTEARLLVQAGGGGAAGGGHGSRIHAGLRQQRIREGCRIARRPRVPAARALRKRCG